MILIYTKDNCPYCELAKELLKSQNVDFEERDIYEDAQVVRELSMQSGMRTFPQIFTGEPSQETLIGGYDDLKALQDSGELSQKLG